MMRRLSLAMVVVGWLVVGAAAGWLPAAEPTERYVVQPELTRKSPRGTFRIEQRCWKREEGWEWQTWVVPRNPRAEAYPLPHSPRYSAGYGAECFVSADETVLVYLQKTGSGDNAVDLYVRGRAGHFALMEAPSTFDRRVWSEFDRRSGFKTDAWKCRYHEWIDFLGWEPDGQTCALRLGGQHCFEDYYAHDWQMHYNVQTKKFFQTVDEQAHDRRALHWKTWRRPGVSRDARK